MSAKNRSITPEHARLLAQAWRLYAETGDSRDLAGALSLTDTAMRAQCGSSKPKRWKPKPYRTRAGGGISLDPCASILAQLRDRVR